MTRSNAYRDSLIRLSEAAMLVRMARSAKSADVSSALAKAATVAVAAALERYVNDFVTELCRSIDAETFDELSEGMKRYVAFQIAQQVRHATRPLVTSRNRDVGEKARERLRAALKLGISCLDSPKSLKSHWSFGMFMDGAGAPDRLERTLRPFFPTDAGLFDTLERRGRDRAAIAAAIGSLVDARHKVAHAERNVYVGPQDVRQWLCLTLILVREIETALFVQVHPESGT